MSQNLPFALGPAVQGLPWNNTTQGMLNSAIQGGPPTAAFFSIQDSITQLVTSINSPSGSAWTQGTDAAGNPTMTAQSSMNGNTMTMTLQTTFSPDVVSGQNTPEGFQWQGNNYNVVGSLQAILTYNQLDLWTVQVPIGLASMVPVTALSGYAWSGLVQPLLQGFWQGVKSCFSSAPEVGSMEEAGAASADAAEEAGVEGAAVEDATVSLAAGAGAFIGILVVIAIGFIVSLLGHYTYQNLKIYNLTPYDVTWMVGYMDEGVMNAAPVSSTGSGAFDPLIPAMSALSPGQGYNPVTVAHEGSFSFVSQGEYAGFAYVMTLNLTDPNNGGKPVANAAVMFDLPWGAHNSLYATFNPPSDLEQLEEQTGGEYKQTCFMASGPNLLLTANYDAISGEQTLPGGGSGYVYNSLVVISTPEQPS